MVWSFLSYIENAPGTKAGWLCLANDGVDALYVVRGGSGGSTLLNKYTFSSLPNTPVWFVAGAYSIDLVVKGSYVYNLSGSGSDITRYATSDGSLDPTPFYTCADTFAISFACTGSNWFVGDDNVIRVLDLAGTEILPALSYPALVTVIRTDGTYLYVSDAVGDGKWVRKLNLDATPTGVEWNTDEVVTNNTLAVGPDGNIYQLRADGVTVRVYSNTGVIIEDIAVTLAYPGGRALTIADELVFASSIYAGEIVIGVEVKKYGEAPPPPPPPPLPPSIPDIDRVRGSVTFSGSPLCSVNLFYTYLKSYLLDGEVYDKSSKAVPYTNRPVVFTGNIGRPYLGQEVRIEHTNDAKGGTYYVKTDENGDFTISITLGLGENKIRAVDTSDEQASGFVIFYAYYIHFFLCLYAVELLILRRMFMQTKANQFLGDYLVGDETYPELPSATEYFTVEQNALVRNYARQLSYSTPPGLSREDMIIQLQKVFEAFGMAPTERAMNLLMSSVVGAIPNYVNYYERPHFWIGEKACKRKFYMENGVTFAKESDIGKTVLGDSSGTVGTLVGFEATGYLPPSSPQVWIVRTDHPTDFNVVEDVSVVEGTGEGTMKSVSTEYFSPGFWKLRKGVNYPVWSEGSSICWERSYFTFYGRRFVLERGTADLQDSKYGLEMPGSEASKQYWVWVGGDTLKAGYVSLLDVGITAVCPTTSIVTKVEEFAVADVLQDFTGGITGRKKEYYVKTLNPILVFGGISSTEPPPAGDDFSYARYVEESNVVALGNTWVPTYSFEVEYGYRKEFQILGVVSMENSGV